ncbi:M20 family metallopeptidase [Selenomonas sp. WCA-380-WT-3B 3/]|uniref:M20 family metallopeptidase n=1 Tax=Selenomonas montiformis TaxID=2652285 RepID=A0A6I2UVU9_9FIRM|nr:M20 family metallopeptidase [Selenomonas montiformis]MSV24174.1 M20 family metallopeptidase [Selenomonas montiformis]
MDNLQLDEYLKELEYLVNIDSVSYDPEGASRIAAFFQEKYESMGWKVTMHRFHKDIAPCLEIVNRPAKRYDVLILAHMDTVFPLGTAAQHPFHIEGDRAFGPGVIDCKAGLLSGWYALRRLQGDDSLKNANVCVFLNSDHEGISSRYSKNYSVKLAGKSRCVLVLEAGRANGNLVNKRKGIARYKLHIAGVSAHAGIDYTSGCSAVEELAHWILALQRATNLDRETTVNVGKISGGTSISAVPGNAEAEIDVRYYEPDEVERIEKLMERYAASPHVKGTSAKIEGGITRPPMVPTEATYQLCRSVDRIGQKIGVNFSWMASGGGSDGSFSAAAGIPTIDGLGPVGGKAHSAAEYLDIPSILPRYELLSRIIQHVVMHSSLH